MEHQSCLSISRACLLLDMVAILFLHEAFLLPMK
jgi:hypothetical protein